jgi:hypothetical protein
MADLQAFPSEASRNTAAQVGAIGAATNQITAVFKPFGDFFSRVNSLVQPRHLWTGFFVVLGGTMVVVGVVMYLKGDEIAAAGRGAVARAGSEAVKAGEVAAVA